MSGVTQERREALLLAAKQWRDYGATCAPGIGDEAAIRAAASLEQEAETGTSVCACCFKPFARPMSLFT